MATAKSKETGAVIHRLNLGSIDSVLRPRTPVHGYAIHHPDGVVLVDAGYRLSVSPKYRRERGLLPRRMDEALADYELELADVALVIVTHLHQDHSGQLAAVRGKPVFVRGAELDRARREESEECLAHFDFVEARWEVFDEDVEVLPGIRTISSPGHTIGHQSVLVATERGSELIVGDAAYTAEIYTDPEVLDPSSPIAGPQIGVTRDMWLDSIGRLRLLKPDRVHFSHDGATLEGDPTSPRLDNGA